MTNDLVSRLRLSAKSADTFGLCYNALATDVAKAADRIERLEKALLECEAIVTRWQKRNEDDTEWKGSKTSQNKSRAVASRCGMMLGDVRKHVSKALGGGG